MRRPGDVVTEGQQEVEVSKGVVGEGVGEPQLSGVDIVLLFQCFRCPGRSVSHPKSRDLSHVLLLIVLVSLVCGSSRSALRPPPPDLRRLLLGSVPLLGRNDLQLPTNSETLSSRLMKSQTGCYFRFTSRSRKNAKRSSALTTNLTWWTVSTLSLTSGSIGKINT